MPWLIPEIKGLMHKGDYDYEHKKAISTNGELHWSNYKRYTMLLTPKYVKRNVIIIPTSRTLKHVEDIKQHLA